ncbi:MAG: sulfite exporter TauE/SafE family protein [Micrococcales bacterium]|nr:sulfite exporter TauE/SafE family protein [Micrococcales bacterium]
MHDLLTHTALSVVIAGFIVGLIVGVTGMGGGALMTPTLIFLGVGDTTAIVTADLVASAFSKTGGALVHARAGSTHWPLAKWLILGSVPTALLGPEVLSLVVQPGQLDQVLMVAIGIAMLLAAATYAARLYLNLRRVRGGGEAADPDPRILPVATVLVGALGGLLVGITSVGSGSVIMVALLTLYPGLPAVRLVGTDMVQGIPLVLAAAISNIFLHGLQWDIVIPLIVGSTPGTMIGSRVAPHVPQSFVRRAIVVVLTMSAVALLDKAQIGLFGGGSHPLAAVAVGATVVILLPLVWGAIRRRQGLPMFGAPTVAELERLPGDRQRSRG